jgi:hypothetical protein
MAQHELSDTSSNDCKGSAIFEQRQSIPALESYELMSLVQKVV